MNIYECFIDCVIIADQGLTVKHKEEATSYPFKLKEKLTAEKSGKGFTYFILYEAGLGFFGQSYIL